MKWRWNALARDLFNLEGEDTGVISQEVEQIYPTCVQELPATDGQLYKCVNYKSLHFYLVELISHNYNLSKRIPDTTLRDF